MSVASSSKILDLVLRPATVADHLAFVQLYPELGVDDPVPDEARWTRDMMRDCSIAVSLADPGVARGVIWADVLGDTGYVRIVIVARSARGRGVGRALMEHARSTLAAKGCTRWCLNVKETNVAARSLYGKLGLSTAFVSSKLSLRWDALDRLPPSPPGLLVHALDPADDAMVEPAIDVPSGWLARARAMKISLFLRLVDPAEPQKVAGFVRFTPSFPSAFPFHVTDVGYAQALFRAMRPHALPGQESVGLIVENNAALTQVLLDASAVVGFDMLHLRGRL